MKKYTYYLMVSLFFAFLKIGADSGTGPIITFFFKTINHKKEKLSDFRAPGSIAKHCVACIAKHSPVAGIIATYNGYVSVSDYNGEIVFPRRHQKPVVNILITKELIPIFMFSKTIHHWELVPGVPAVMYSIKRIDNPDGDSEWDITSMDVPADNKIHPATLIIDADPKFIIINQGKTPTIQSPNLVLPPVLVKKGIEIVPRSIENLDIRFLFKPVATKNKQEAVRLTTHTLN